MSKAIRSRMVKELTTRFRGVKSGVFVNFNGLDGKMADSLRKELATAHAEMDVLKNSLARLAFKDLGVTGLDKTLSGLVALVHGPDAAAVAKKLLTWKDKNKKLEIRSGLLEKTVLTVDQVKHLSTLPDRQTLLTQIAVAMASPMSGFATGLNALTQKMAQLLKALEEKKSKEGGAPA